MDQHRAVEKQRLRRRFRVRKRLRGTAEQPRLTVCRTHRNIQAQLIDDKSGTTLASASTADKELAGKIKFGGNVSAAEIIGKAIAEKAVTKGVTKVCFDRGACKYHGRVAALANAARAAGLQF